MLRSGRGRKGTPVGGPNGSEGFTSVALDGMNVVGWTALALAIRPIVGWRYRVFRTWEVSFDGWYGLWRRWCWWSRLEGVSYSTVMVPTMSISTCGSQM
ncbi:MAG: hypothetical protein CL927_16070 [Deltaproteobacteria bacterium]|nr:hypothetical protein [Deltaproteobacteria bacterium]